MLVWHSQFAKARLLVAAAGAALLSACVGGRTAQVTTPTTPVAVYGDTLRLGTFGDGDTLYFSYTQMYAHTEGTHYGIRVVAHGDSVHAAQLLYPETWVGWQHDGGLATFFHGLRPQARVLAQSHRPRGRQLAQLDSVLQRMYRHTTYGAQVPGNYYALEWGTRRSVVDDPSCCLFLHGAVQEVLDLPLQPHALYKKPRRD